MTDIAPSWRPADRGWPYGPHREADAPDAVVVGRPGSWPSPREEVRPLPEAARRQRQRINQLAHERTTP